MSSLIDISTRKGVGSFKLASSGTLALVLAASLAISGCTRSSNLNQGALPPAPLTPAPLDPVESSALDPLDPNAPDPNAVDPNAPPTQIASAEPPAGGGKEVTREALVGAWTISTGGTACQIFLALTKWSGGFRAASRGCNAPSIADVQAWDVKGKQVILVDSAGATAARLYRTAEARFDGSTANGTPISFSR